MKKVVQKSFKINFLVNELFLLNYCKVKFMLFLDEIIDYMKGKLILMGSIHTDSLLTKFILDQILPFVVVVYLKFQSLIHMLYYRQYTEVNGRLSRSTIRRKTIFIVLDFVLKVKNRFLTVLFLIYGSLINNNKLMRLSLY